MGVNAVIGVGEDGQHGERDDGRGDAQAEERFGAFDAPDDVGARVEERGGGTRDGGLGEGFWVGSTAVICAG